MRNSHTPMCVVLYSCHHSISSTPVVSELHKGCYLRRRLTSEGIMALGVTLSCCMCVCVRRAAYITYRLHATFISAAKVMRCIQCSLVLSVYVCSFVLLYYCIVLCNLRGESQPVNDWSYDKSAVSVWLECTSRVTVALTSTTTRRNNILSKVHMSDERRSREEGWVSWVHVI